MSLFALPIVGFLIGLLIISLGGGGGGIYVGILTAFFNIPPAIAAATSLATIIIRSIWVLSDFPLTVRCTMSSIFPLNAWCWQDSPSCFPKAAERPLLKYAGRHRFWCIAAMRPWSGTMEGTNRFL